MGSTSNGKMHFICWPHLACRWIYADASLLVRFWRTKVLLDGRGVYEHIVDSGYAHTSILVGCLIKKYGSRCAAQDDLMPLFDSIHRQNVSSWNTFMRACNRQSQHLVTLKLFDQMQHEGLVPEKVTFICILSACAGLVTLRPGKQIHARIIGSEFVSDTALLTALLNMYGKCTCLMDASKVFDEMHERDVVAWNAMITVYAEHGYNNEALQLVEQMQQKGVRPNKVTFLSILATTQSAIEKGQQVHDHLLKSGLEADIIVKNALVNLYGKWGMLEDAWKMFQKMPQRDVVSWNAMISAFGNHGQGKEALALCEQMREEGVMPNKITCVSVLSACASQSLLAEGVQIHVHMLNSEYQADIVVGNSVVNMYVKCGSLENAWQMFNRMPKQDVVSYTTMIAVYAEHGHWEQAIQLFQHMQQNGLVPNEVTFVHMLAACMTPLSLDGGKQIHSHILRYGLESSVTVGNALINMYGKCGSPKDVKRLFDKMLERDVVSWNALIAAYTRNGKGKEALHLFCQMQYEGVIPDEITFATILDAFAGHSALPEGEQMHACISERGFEQDIAVGNALVKMYGKCGNLEDAWKTFAKIPEQDVISWNEMISLLAGHGECQKALKLFQQMNLKGIIANEASFVSIFSACANQAMLVEAKRIHACIQGPGLESDVVLGTALVTMYGKCGRLEDAWKMFSKIIEPNTISWNAMIAVHAQHGQGMEVHHLVEEMQQGGVMPDEVTFVSILSACGHVGFIDEAWHCFAFINQSHHMSPNMDHYVCIIDLLARAGRLDEAEDFINGMPVQPTLASFMALLGACRCHSDMERGERAARHVLEFEIDNAAAHVIISSMHATASNKSHAS